MQAGFPLLVANPVVVDLNPSILHLKRASFRTVRRELCAPTPTPSVFPKWTSLETHEALMQIIGVT